MSLKEKKILILVANEYEDLELHYPKLRLAESEAKIVVAGSKAKEKYTGKHGLTCLSDISFDEVNVEDFHALVIPGGYAPDKLRTLPKVLEITKKFHEQNKLIAFICHAGWVPISAGLLRGVRCTSYEAIKDDMINAGAKWVDQEVVVDQNFISSRKPDDLPSFCKSIIQHLEKEQPVPANR